MNVTGLAPAAASLLHDALAQGRPRTLVFGTPAGAARDALAALVPAALAPGLRLRDRAAAELVVAGLWLGYDFMDEAHEVAQSIDAIGGSYWHALVHRREPDPANAAYWFRRVPDHPIWPELLADARALAPTFPELFTARRWDARRFAELCAAADDSSEAAAPLQAIARREWALLIEHDFRAAFG